MDPSSLRYPEQATASVGVRGPGDLVAPARGQSGDQTTGNQESARQTNAARLFQDTWAQGRIGAVGRNMMSLGTTHRAALHRRPYVLAIAIGCAWAVASRHIEALRLLDF
jgi:hypothetical protein